MLPQLPLLGLRQALVGVDPGGVLDQLLVVGDHDVIVALEGLGEGNEARPGAEQAGVDQGPLGLAGLVVQVRWRRWCRCGRWRGRAGCGLPRYGWSRCRASGVLPFRSLMGCLLVMTCCRARHDADSSTPGVGQDPRGGHANPRGPGSSANAGRRHEPRSASLLHPSPSMTAMSGEDDALDPSAGLFSRGRC